MSLGAFFNADFIAIVRPKIVFIIIAPLPSSTLIFEYIQALLFRCRIPAAVRARSSTYTAWTLSLGVCIIITAIYYLIELRVPYALDLVRAAVLTGVTS